MNANTAQLDAVLVYTTTDNANNIGQSQIAYISCDPSNYPGNINASRVVQDLSSVATAAILYSTTEKYCNLTTSDPDLDQFAIYSTTDMSDASRQQEKLQALQAGVLFNAKVTRYTQNSSSSPGGQNQNSGQPNPLGPSPSTAVAMIILYSITGVITALFLVIIVTGAVRAHRHPDRYGPRDVMGRPRQSRARGLGMAILDTIPIVKFGEQREQAKTTDVELGSVSEARGVDGADATATSTAPTTTSAQETKITTPDVTGADHAVPLDSGIAPAAVAGKDSGEDEGLGCSICTDDFEKGQDIRVLPCNHKFHPECVDPWLLNVSGTCPLW